MENQTPPEPNANDEPGIVVTQQKINAYKFTKTIFILNIWLCLGLWLSSVAPCIDILKGQIHDNYEEISRAFAVKNAGKLIGSFIGGYLADRFQRWIDLQLGLSVLLAGLSYTSIPWAPNLPVMASAFFMNGLGAGSICASGMAHATNLWGKEASGPIHAIHSGFGIGRIIGPLIVAPFLPKVKHNKTTLHYVPMHEFIEDEMFVSSSSFYGQYSNHSTSPNITSADVTIPFAIIGSYSCLIASVFFIYSCFPFDRYQQSQQEGRGENRNKSFKKIFSPESCAGGNKMYALQMFSMIFLFYVLMVGRNSFIVMFMQPIAVNTPTLHFSLQEADILITVFFTCFTAGRIVTSIIFKCVPIQVVIFIESIGILASTIAMVMTGVHSKLAFWLTLCCYGFVNGPINPSGMAWSNQYLTMTGTAFAILDMGIASGAFIFNWLCGYLFNIYHDNVVVLYYYAVACASASMLLLIMMQVRGSMHGVMSSNQENRNTIENNSPEDISPLIR